MSGLVSYHAGASAEAAVARHYEEGGDTILALRWRGRGGEIDIIARDAEGLIFVEVKKSRSHARAAERLGPRQVARIQSAAAEYLMRAGLSMDTAMRFDVALVDAIGRIEIIRDALSA